MRDEPLYTSQVREMPAEDRPRERLMRLGPDALRDGELLAVLFRTGTREEGAVALADRVIRHFGDLRGLARASIEEIQQVKGIGSVKAIEIKAALELGRRLVEHTGPDRIRISGAEDVVRMLMPRYKDCEVEVFRCVLMNVRNEVLKVVDVSQGGLAGAPASPNDVFRQAVREAAYSVILCHNHPSGNPEPSRDDVDLTRRLREAGQLLGITVLDHVIFGDGRYVSLKERGHV